jgi:sugar lactone lactonase YvrE
VHVFAGGPEPGNQLNQLNYPTDVLIDKDTNSLIISDQGNKRVVRWPLDNGTQGEVLVDNINCYGLAMDNQGRLYVSDDEKHQVRRFPRDDKKGIVVAGGTVAGADLNQLNWPSYIVVDEKQSLYVSDCGNHRVMKWVKDATQGIVVAGGNGEGDALTQLNHPRGIWVDKAGTVYIAEGGNSRVTRWPQGKKTGIVLLGGNGRGDATNQFNGVRGLSFDRRGNLYVAEYVNDRVQKFKLEEKLNTRCVIT